jgi:hypothetical protein
MTAETVAETGPSDQTMKYIYIYLKTIQNKLLLSLINKENELE